MIEGETFVIDNEGSGEPYIYCALCLHCDEPIRPSYRADSPQPFHYECLLRGVIGSVAHLNKQCGCFIAGSAEGDPPGMTRREAAKAAVELWQRQQTKT